MSSSNLGANGNGMAINPASYTEVVWNDQNTGALRPVSDADDASLISPDRVTVRGVTKAVHELANYSGSTLVVAGKTFAVNLAVVLMTDGSFAIRLHDAEIPRHANYLNVTQLKLGRFDGAEYALQDPAYRDAPFICFVAGTRIRTQNGFRRVEWISPGDLVYTADHGLQPVRWVAMKTVSGHDRGAPVHIAAGAFGNRRPVEVSQHHRFVTTNALAELAIGTSETLIAAIHLVNGSSITLRPCNRVTYIHIMFDQHEIIYAENLPTESFHPSLSGLATLDGPTRAELHRIFPELAGDLSSYGPTARPTPRGYEVAATLVPMREQVMQPRGRRRLQ